MKTPGILILLTFLVSLPSIAEEEQKKPKKQPELTPVIRAMFSSPRNRDVRVHDSAIEFGVWCDLDGSCWDYDSNPCQYGNLSGHDGPC